jgi:hypothetical protein
MVKFFYRYNFRPLVGDTDGFNFAAPSNIIMILNMSQKGSHWKTTNDGGKELGLYGHQREFNENIYGRSYGLDLDDICSSTINRKIINDI